MPPPRAVGDDRGVDVPDDVGHGGVARVQEQPAGRGELRAAAGLPVDERHEPHAGPAPLGGHEPHVVVGVGRVETDEGEA